MPLYVNEICIGLHAKCNWQCEYCVARWDDAKIDEDKIIQDIESVKDSLKTLWLSGGEPGLLSVQFWDYLFYHVKHRLSICTNGTFIKRGYANRYGSKIRRIMLHCVQEIDQDIDPYVLQFIRETDIDMTVNFVIHRNNPHLISNFLNKYNDIEFEVNFADQTFAEINKEHGKAYNCLMDKDSIIETVIQLGKFNKYNRYTDFLTRKLIQNDFKYLNPWSYKNHD